ncbi:ABC transporter ATP-binding protein [Zavarzinella formosa]|uniref:ABC transporter ATP-binding protein n=1 Tax=Zavarzinella formosa TaxID=360055 RepID=UPI0003177EE9|nr:ABC transporter ATP-binding protein [Zavarzinella formosa]
MSETMLDLRGVSKSFGQKLVLNEVDLTLPAGSVLGLVGKNGGGKTTLLKCALGLQRPQHGDIRILGEPAWELSATGKERLGYVPQKIDLYPWMKIRQITAYTGAFYPKWNKTLVERLLREWELNPEDRVGPLSVGQTQKLAIILALGHEPDLLVLDEPAASLDPVARRQFLETLLDMVGERTVLFSTHITSDLERVADRVAVLKDGKIIYSGELDALKDSVKRLHVRAALPLPNDAFHMPGLLHAKVTGNEAVVSVRDFTPDLPEQIARQWSASVTAQDLNLEDIFLELHHG